MAAANFCEILGKRNHMRRYQQTAKDVKAAAIEHLWSDKLDSFVRIAEVENGKVTHDETVDASSLFGLWVFRMLPQDHDKFIRTHHQVMKRLQNPTDIGGIIRYENDYYFRSGKLSNPWFITTLWEVLRRLRNDNFSL